MLIYSYHTHSHWLNLILATRCVYFPLFCTHHKEREKKEKKNWNFFMLTLLGRAKNSFPVYGISLYTERKESIYSIEQNIKEVLGFAFYMTGTILLLLSKSKKARKKFWMEVKKNPLCRLFLVSKHRHKLASCAVVWVPTYISNKIKFPFLLYSSWNRSTFRVMCKTM